MYTGRIIAGRPGQIRLDEKSCPKETADMIFALMDQYASVKRIVNFTDNLHYENDGVTIMDLLRFGEYAKLNELIQPTIHLIAQAQSAALAELKIPIAENTGISLGWFSSLTESGVFGPGHEGRKKSAVHIRNRNICMQGIQGNYGALKNPDPDKNNITQRAMGCFITYLNAGFSGRDPVAEIAGENSPSTVVIAYKDEAADKLKKETRARGLRFYKLSLPGYHSSHAGDAGIKVGKYFSGVDIYDPTTPVRSDLDGSLLTSAQQIRDTINVHTSGKLQYQIALEEALEIHRKGGGIVETKPKVSQTFIGLGLGSVPVNYATELAKFHSIKVNAFSAFDGKGQRSEELEKLTRK